ncbi:CotH kinase family protein [Lactiplantibacillus plantarum]|uniref:CotH kinase family protein n=1 Tax=Lactiplantibacillus plantarum TaxID=1590 RepID=UPI003F497EB2
MATDDTALTGAEKSSIEGIANAVRQKMYGKDVRESIASGLELVGNVVNTVAQQAASSLNYGYFQDGPQAKNGTTVSQIVWNGSTWIQLQGDTTTQYKGLTWSIPYSNFPDFFGYPAKIEFDFQSSINQQFDLRIDFFDANGNNLKSDLIKSIYFNTWNYRHITALYFAKKIDNVSLIKISLVSLSNNIGKCLIKNATCTSVYHGDEELLNKSAIANSGTVLDNFNYQGRNWLKMTGDSTTQYKGAYFEVDFADHLNFDIWGEPLTFKFLAQSSIDTTEDSVKWIINIAYRDSNGKLLGIDPLKHVNFKQWKYREVQVNFQLNNQYKSQAASFEIQLVSNDTKDIGSVLITDVNLDYNFDNDHSKGTLISNDFSDGGSQDAIANASTSLGITRWLGKNWLQITGANTDQYKGVNWDIWFNTHNNFDIWGEPLKFSFLAQSSIDTTKDSVKWIINIAYRDSNGKLLGIDPLKHVNFKQWKYREVQVNFQLNNQYKSQAASFEIQLVSNDTKDIGSVLITDVSLGYNFESYDYAGVENDGLPHIYLNGDTSSMTKDNKVVLRFDFANFNNHVSGYAQTCWQGDSSIRWPKKAYRIKTFTDSALTNKLNFQPSHRWTADNKWNLKAYYTDGLLCRDVANANIGAAIEATSTSNPEGLITTDNFGFVDGFPVSVYINGKFQGIFSFNIAKGDYGKTKAIIDGANYTSVTKFESYPTGGDALDGTNFEMVDPDAPTDDIKNGFNTMLNFAITSSDTDFTTGIDKYLDKGSVIDYLIFSNIIGNTDAWGKNQTFFSYDLAKWYIHPYDLDVSLGGEWNGTLNPKPTGILGVDSSKHQLFVRFTKLFPNEIKARYQSLRTWLTPAYVLNEYRKRIDSIGDGNYQRDYDKWSNPSKDIYTWKQLSDYVVNQFKICDAAWLQS